MKLKPEHSYQITIPENEYFKEEVKNLIIMDKSTKVWCNPERYSKKLSSSSWYYVVDMDRDIQHWFKLEEEHKVEETL